MNLVSIIIPCYNHACYLDECLQSVLNQTITHWECIIINDGSNDNTHQIAKKWCDLDNRFIYIEQENKGVSASRNLGVQKSNGKYLLPLDADDYISSNYIEACLNELITNKNLKLVYGEAIKFGAENGVWNLTEYSFKKLLQYNMIFCTALFYRADYEKTSGYDEEMELGLEDWEFWIRLLKTDSEVSHIKSCQLFYRVKSDSRNKDLYKNKDKVNLTFYYVYKKHINLYRMNNIVYLFKKNIHLYGVHKVIGLFQKHIKSNS